MRRLLLILMVGAVYILHQDFWNWKKAEPLVWGILPIGLAYHAAYSVMAAIMMAILVKFAFPDHLASLADEAPNQQDGAKGTKGGHS